MSRNNDFVDVRETTHGSFTRTFNFPTEAETKGYVLSFFLCFGPETFLSMFLSYLVYIEFQKTDINVTREPNKKIIVRCVVSNSFGNTKVFLGVFSSMQMNKNACIIIS